MADAIKLERLKLEQYKARMDHERVNLERERDALTRQKILFDAVIVFASIAIKAILVTNGIAAIGLVALLASTYPVYAQNSEFWCAIQSFGHGTLAGTLTVALAYLTQAIYSQAQSLNTIRLWGGGFRLLSIGMASLGIWCIYAGISHFINSLSPSSMRVISGEQKAALTTYPIAELATAFAPYAWPLTALLLALFFVFVFREPVSLLLQRMTRLNKDGVEFSLPHQPEKTDPPDDIQLSSSPRDSDPTILPWLEKLDEEIHTRHFSGDDLIGRLKTALATNIRNALFERVSRLIFGTQLLALRRMASSSGLTTEELKEIFAEHVKRVGDTIRTDYVAWVGFLEGNELAEYSSTKLSLTSIGLLYLEFAKSAGITEAKGG